MGWLWVFLKIYIRALQHGSDLDEVVEEKLLIGDRPKLSNDPENLKPLKERLLERVDEERKEVRSERLGISKLSNGEQLSQAESAFYDFCTAIADWLEPHHDHTRPPPAQVLAKASKLTEQKTGHPLKGYNPSNDETINHPHRREEDAPVVQDAPGSIFDFFDGESIGKIFEMASEEAC
jgi:N-terminal acetyltransferase B complex non-catalytic subunit